jgi:hypothetical protein
MLQIYEGTWIEKQKNVGSVILSGALMISYCFKKVKFLIIIIITIPGIILSVMVRRGILGVFMTSSNFILHCCLSNYKYLCI